LYWVRPIGIPIAVVKSIPIRREPRTFFVTNTEVIAKPITANNPVPAVISPRVTSVDSLLTTNPAFFKPMNAMKRPIPAPMACLSVTGMA